MRDEMRSRSGRPKAMQGLSMASIESDVFTEMAGIFSRQNSMRGVGVDGLRRASCVGVSTLEVEDLGLTTKRPGAGLWLRAGASPRSASPYLVLVGPGACGAANWLCAYFKSLFYI